MLEETKATRNNSDRQTEKQLRQDTIITHVFTVYELAWLLRPPLTGIRWLSKRPKFQIFFKKCSSCGMVRVSRTAQTELLNPEERKNLPRFPLKFVTTPIATYPASGENLSRLYVAQLPSFALVKVSSLEKRSKN